MSNLILGSEVSVLGGDSLNLVLQNILNDVSALMGPTRHILYTSFEQLGLDPATVTLKDLALSTSLYSMVVIGVDAGQAYASTLPMPSISQSSSPEYMGGLLIVETVGSDYRRVNFTFKSRNNYATCSYNQYQGSSVSGWRFHSPDYVNSQYPNASSWGGLISNIWVPGTYFFSSAEIANFTDKPSGFAGSAYIHVGNKDSSFTGDRHYTFRANFTPPQVYTRVVTTSANGGWYRYTLTAV